MRYATKYAHPPGIVPRTIRRATACSALALALGAAAACTGDKAGPTASAAVAVDGETLFRGIFFGEGRVGGLLPELRPAGYAAPAAGQAARVAAVREEMVARIRASDPAFFARFGAAVTSGRHLPIERVMDEARGQVTVALGERTEASTAASADEDMVIVLGPFLYFVTYYDLYAVYVIGGDQLAPSASAGLERDAVVDLLARRLGTPNLTLSPGR